MKFKNMFKVLFGVLFMLTISCSQEDDLLEMNQIKLQQNELLSKDIESKIAADELYIEFNSQTLSYLKTIKKSIRKNNVDVQSITEKSSIEDLSELLDLPDDYLLSNYMEIYDTGQALIEKYDLIRLEEQQVQTVFSNVRNLNKIKNLKFRANTLRLKSNNCEEQFADDFNEIHDAYDSGIIVCGFWAIMTAGGATLPCYTTLVTGTLIRIAEAIDDYNQCVENNE